MADKKQVADVNHFGVYVAACTYTCTYTCTCTCTIDLVRYNWKPMC